MFVVDVGYRMLVVVNLDMLLQFAIFVPFFNLDKILMSL